MGLSIAFAGGITMMTLLIIFGVFAVMLFQVQVETTSSSQAFDNNDEFTKTDVRISGVNASSGSPLVNFTLINEGSEKLWNYDEFDVIIRYDADISGTQARVTEQFTYNATAFTVSTGQESTIPDFKIQRDTGVFAAASTTLTLTEGGEFTECVGPCYIQLVNTRHTGIGDTTVANSIAPEAWTAYISNDDGLRPGGLSTITFTRDATGGVDNRITWQITEYVGLPTGDNAIIVHDSDVCTFGAASLTCTGTQITPAISNDADIAVLITGIGSPSSSTSEVPAQLITSAWDNINDEPEFERGHSLGEAVDVSYAVIEYVGVNWSLERIPHSGSSIVLTTETATIPIQSRAFILQAQQENEGLEGNVDGLCQTGEEVWISARNEVSFNHPWQATSWGSEPMNEIVWIVTNSDTNQKTEMIVEHLQPTDQRDTIGGSEENWQVTITPLTYGLSEAAINGMSTHTDGCGTFFPRSSIGARLTDTTTVDFWQSDDGQENDYAFSVVQYPRAGACLGGTSDIIDVNEWTINCIQFDYFEPGIVNSYEAPEILTKLQNPIFANGMLEISISTDNGGTANKTTTVS